jgi:hypothetical protein
MPTIRKGLSSIQMSTTEIRSVLHPSNKASQCRVCPNGESWQAERRPDFKSKRMYCIGDLQRMHDMLVKARVCDAPGLRSSALEPGEIWAIGVILESGGL